MSGLIHAFVFTNGSSSFDFAFRSVKEQTLKVPVSVIRNKPISEAMKQCVKDSTCPWFMKIDDDMFLHPKAMEYFMSVATKHNNNRVAMAGACLWEFWSKRIIDCLKIYNVEHTKKCVWNMDKRGKIDRTFTKYLYKQNLKRKIDKKSVVALHSSRLSFEQKHYKNMWKRNVKGSKENNFEIKSKQINETDRKNLEKQYSKMSRLVKINKKRNSLFMKYISD